MSKRIRFLRMFVFITFVGVSMTGCRGNLVRDEKISKLDEIALVIDATVLNERTLKSAQVDVGECEAITERLETVADRVLLRKGYRAKPMMRTVGFGYDSSRSIEVLFDSKFLAGGVSSSPPFVTVLHEGDVVVSKIGELHRRAAEAGLDSKSNIIDATLIGNLNSSRPMLVISASGKSTSGGSMLGNVAKGALNVIASIGSRQAARVMDFDKDTVFMAVQLVEPVSGSVLWQSSRRIETDPDAGNFVEQLSNILGELPHAQH